MFTFALALVAASAPTPAGQWRVEVEGHTYRVKVKAGAVTVADKALVTAPSPQQMARMKQAVADATGCRIEDAYWQDAKLRGGINCL